MAKKKSVVQKAIDAGVNKLQGTFHSPKAGLAEESDKEPTEREIQEQQDCNVKARNRLLGEMDLVIFGASLSDQAIEFSKLKVKLEEAEIIDSKEIVEMDDIMKDLCGDLRTAIKRGDELSMEWLMRALAYGIFKGHESLNGREFANRTTIYAERLANLKKYEEICKSTGDMYIKNESLKEQNKLFASKEQEYVRAMASGSRVMNDPNNQPKLKQIKTLGGDMRAMDASLLEIARILKKALTLHRECEQISEQESLIRYSIDTLKAMIGQLEIDLAWCTSDVINQVQEEIKSMTAATVQRIQNDLNAILDAQDVLERVRVSYQTVYQNERLMEHMTDAVVEFEELQKQYEAGKDFFGNGKIKEYEYIDELLSEETGEIYN